MPPRQVSIKRLRRWGKEHPTIGGPVPKIDLKSWMLVVDGEVEKPLRLDWNEFQRLPMTESVSDFHCVEGWSVLGCRWKGVRFKDLADIVKPKEAARFVSFECADGYSTSLPLDKLLEDDVLLAIKLDGKTLEEGLGAPVRLVVPNKYAYKSALWVTHIRFTRAKELGFWEKRGYSDTADVWKNDRFTR